MSVPVGFLLLAQRAASEGWEGQPGRPPARGTRTIGMCFRRAQSRINQAALENKKVNWDYTRSGKPSSPPSREKVGGAHDEKDGKGTYVGPVLPGTRALRRKEARKLASLCARRGPTIKRWSLDARSGDYASPLAENG